MVLCTRKVCSLAAAWFSLLFSSLLLQKISPVCGVPSCPRSCSCPAIKEVHCTFRHLTAVPKTFPKDTERLNFGDYCSLGTLTNLCSSSESEYRRLNSVSRSAKHGQQNYNSLTEVKGSEFRPLRQLEMLMLHGNDISSIHPGAFYSLRSLQILKLSYNKLTLVNAGMLEGLVSLVRLHLDHNLIDFIEPYSFNGLTSLKLLQLEGNLLKEIHPHTFITVSVLGNFWTSGLKHLHLSDNLLEQLPAAALKTAQRLELLTLHGNPWTCDCQLQWLIEWSEAHEGVLKCKKERGSSETCPQCSYPQHLNGSHLLGLTAGKLTCERPLLQSPLKQWDNPVWAESEAEPDLPYVQDFEKPLGLLTIVLSDSHGNSAHVACDVRHPGDSAPMTWSVNSRTPGELSVNVSLVTVLECHIDREKLQNLWQLVAYYYESPAILERGHLRGNTSGITYQYVQVVNENSPYFTELKGYLVAEPAWLLQPRVILKLNRQQTTTKKLVMDFTTLITKEVSSNRAQEDADNFATSWALLRRGTAGRIQTALEGSKVHLECSVITSDPQVRVEWILPDLSTLEDSNDKIEFSEGGKLVILNASLSDSGVYHCIIRTKSGVDLMPLRLTIKERSLSPTALNGQKITIKRGGFFSLPCEVTSVLPSQTIWYLPKNQVLLPTQKTRRLEVTENGTLVGRKLMQEDAGEYSCVASNLYGVDMLSHVVEVTVVSHFDESKVQPEGQQTIPTLGVEDGEGSGGDYQEITRLFATALPEKVGTSLNRPNRLFKKTLMKNSRRKPNKSIKELDPNRWAEILAKAHSNASAPLLTEQSVEDPSTIIVHKIETTTAVATTGVEKANSLHDITTPLDAESKKLSLVPKIDGKTLSNKKKIQHLHKGLEMSENKLHHSSLPGSTPSTQLSTEGTNEKVRAITNPPFMRTTQLGVRPGIRHPKVPGWPIGRRPPFRRGRPPMRRIHPHIKPFYHPLKNSQTTLRPVPTTISTTTTTTKTTPVTSTTTTTTTTTTPTPTTTLVPTTADYNEHLSAEYNIDEDNYYDDYDYKNSVILNKNEDLNSETTYIPIGNYFTPSPSFSETDPNVSKINVPTTKTFAIPKLDNSYLGKADHLVNLRTTGIKSTGMKEQTETNDRNNKKPHVDDKNKNSMTETKEQEKHRSADIIGEDEENLRAKLVTQSYNVQNNIRLTSQNRPNRPLPEQSIPKHTRTSSVKSFSTNTQEGHAITQGKDKMVNKPTKVPETHSPFIVEPLHPWLLQTNQGNGKTSDSRIMNTNRNRNTGVQTEVNHSKGSHHHKVYPTSHWSSHLHHPHHSYPLNPSWPSQRMFPHLKQGSGSHVAATYRPWPFPHPWVHSSFVTNRPEITAETIKPTPTMATMENSRTIPSKPHHYNLDFSSQTRDKLLMSRLRNRYKQVQLNHTTQLGRAVTSKPIKNHPSPSKPNFRTLQRHYMTKQLFPTPSYSYPLQVPNFGKTSSSLVNRFLPTSVSYHLTTSHSVYEGRQHSFRQPTAAPLLPWLQVAGGGGVKPRINTVTTTSMSVLAETDVFLPCKATGNPEPNIAWTKVSTGATISSNTRHGPRFEVFKNGTFLIKNIQLQDRGQYLCMAQNRLGSDQMAITLSVQVESPKIQRPKSTEIVVYLGKGATLHCLASGKPAAQISWILPDRTFVREVGTVHSIFSTISLLQNGTLQIHSTNFTSKGDYKCIASNAAGADTITYHLHVAALPPSISEAPTDNLIVQPGRNVYVHCSVKGEPAPTLKWIIPEGIHVKPSQFLGSRIYIFPNGTLLVKNVSPSNSGRYECLATNAVGIAKRTVQLEVEAHSFLFSHQPLPPLSIPFTPNHATPSRQHVVSAMYGSTVYLHCPESTGSSRGTVWQLPSKAIFEHQSSPERPIKAFRNGTLRILQLTELDGGKYLCIFQRPNGEDMELFQVDVLMTPPRIEHLKTAKAEITYGENFQVDCVATGLPDPEVSWSLPDGTMINNALQSDDSGLRNRRYVMFENGTLLLQHINKKDEGDYTCYAKNKLGKDERKLSVRVAPKSPQIGLKSQSKVMVKLGESTKLECKATGEPLPKIIWISPQKDVISLSTEKFEVMDDGMLIIKKVTLADEGKYACVARNSVGGDIKYTTVEVEHQKPFINGMKGESSTKLLGVSYQTALMDCRVEGKPEPKIWWITPYGLSLTTPYLGGRFQVHQNGSLELRGVRKTDEGRYTCLAKNHLGETSLSVELQVASLAEKPSFAVPNIEILPIKQDGSGITLKCPARGKPNPELSWLLPNGTMLTPGLRLQRFIHHLLNGTLQIFNPVANDKGVYRCIARNMAGQAEKRYALEAGRKPVIRGYTGGMRITFGLNLNLPCTVDGWPQASITWTLPNGVVLDKPQTIGRISFFNNGTLQIKQVATFDKGTYICKATNAYGSTALSYPVTVMVFPPRITTTMPPITKINQGTPVILQCVANGMPKPDISWTLPGRTTLLPQNRYTVRGGIHITQDGYLVIQNPVLTNSGIYKCNAKNALGTDFKSTYLQVV